MKVIHINSDYGNTIYKELADNLFELGVEQRVFKFANSSNSFDEEYDEFVDIRINHNQFDRYIFHLKHHKVVKDFIRYLSDKDVDILHAHTLFSNGYVAYQTYLKKKIPYIVTVRNTDINIFLKYMIHLRRTGIKILLNAEKIIFISPAHKKTVFKNYVPNKYREILMEKSIVIPNGIADYYFENRSTPKKIGNSKTLTVLTAAWINNNKNQINVCKAINSLNLKGYNINYRIVGGVEKENTYEELLEELQQYPFVELIRRKSKEELILEYRQADIFAMVSHKETFGLSYIESLLQGTPIIYTRDQGVDGYFKDGEVGYSADSTSVKDIAKKIELLIKNYNQLSLNTVNKVERFKWSKISLQYKAIYNSIESRESN